MSSVQRSHPLPPPPPAGQHLQYQQTPQRPEGRHRSKSSFSLRSDKSHKSSGSAPKVDNHETAKEKNSRRLSLTTKADPRLAMEEAEPSAVAAAQPTSLAPLRAIQHLDGNGNPIADPDRSNPTRSRWERPLDTIRSFEAAIDGNYSRKSYMRTESADSGSGNARRSSYFGGPNGGAMGRGHAQDSYNGGRPINFRPDSYIDNKGINNGMSRPGSYYDNNTRPSNGYYPSRARYPRTASEPHFNGGTGIYPAYGNQQSYETVTTTSVSGSSGDPLGYSTDPSSDNSSLDRVQPPSVPEHGNGGYGTHNYQAANYAANGYGVSQGKQPDMPAAGGGYQFKIGAPPPLPRKDINQGLPRVPIKLGTSAGTATTNQQATRPGAGEKRKSWFGKRFSRG